MYHDKFCPITLNPDLTTLQCICKAAQKIREDERNIIFRGMDRHIFEHLIKYAEAMTDDWK